MAGEGDVSSRTALFAAALCVVALLGVAAPVSSAPVTVQDVRFWTAPDHTRVVVDCSSSPTYKDSRRTAPERIVVDIRGARLVRRLSRVEVGDGLIKRVRLNTLRGGVVQIVIDLDRREDYRVYTLPAAGNKPHRIVIDVARPETRAEAERRARMIAELERSRTTIVMIDPGHGGEDPGAIGARGVKEKHVCLKLGRALRDEINKRRGYQAFLTRDGDYYVSLRRRTEIAREHHADYFVSIHTNASKNRKVSGSEVYFLSMSGASDESATAVAQRENAADRIGGVPGESKDVIEEILMDLMQNAAMERSSRLADAIIDHIDDETALHMRGVKQAGFDVLKTAGMPSVLIEVAFITHGKDAKLLGSKSFRKQFVRAVADGVVEYARLESSHGPTPGD
jgi:N-acetylmuramoyl-L-alanine amidase